LTFIVLILMPQSQLQLLARTGLGSYIQSDVCAADCRTARCSRI